MNDRGGWQVLSDAINSGDSDRLQSAVILLSEVPKKKLVEMGIGNLKIGPEETTIETLVELLKKIILKQFRDKYSKKYVEALVQQNLLKD